MPTRKTKTSLAYNWMESIYQWKKAFSGRLCFVCKVRTVIMLTFGTFVVGVCGLQTSLPYVDALQIFNQTLLFRLSFFKLTTYSFARFPDLNVSGQR